MSRKEAAEKKAHPDSRAAAPSPGAGKAVPAGAGVPSRTADVSAGAGVPALTEDVPAGAGGVPAVAPKGTSPGKRGAGSVRLDKLLGQEGFGTRSELGKAIRKGRVLVNGAVAKDPGLKVSSEDEIVFDGQPVRQDAQVYYMLHKPAGVITATEDSRERTVLDLLRNPGSADAGSVEAESPTPPKAGFSMESRGNPPDQVPSCGPCRKVVPKPVLRRGLFPVGRLDKDTEGLLLITDDGQLAHRLLAPGKHVDKTYYAVVAGRVTEEDIRAFAEGLEVDGEFTAMPALLRTEIREDSAYSALIPKDISRFLSDENTPCSQTLVTIREGKYHQIRRMFAARGMEVLYLKRLSMGPLSLDASLAPGQFRPLTPEEIRMLWSADTAEKMK